MTDTERIEKLREYLVKEKLNAPPGFSPVSQSIMLCGIITAYWDGIGGDKGNDIANVIQRVLAGKSPF